MGWRTGLAAAARLSRAVSAVRPDVPVIAISPSLKVCRQLIVGRAMFPIHAPDGAADPAKMARDAGFAPAGQPVVVIDGDSNLSLVQ